MFDGKEVIYLTENRKKWLAEYRKQMLEKYQRFPLTAQDWSEILDKGRDVCDRAKQDEETTQILVLINKEIKGYEMYHRAKNELDEFFGK